MGSAATARRWDDLPSGSKQRCGNNFDFFFFFLLGKKLIKVYACFSFTSSHQLVKTKKKKKWGFVHVFWNSICHRVSGVINNACCIFRYKVQWSYSIRWKMLMVNVHIKSVKVHFIGQTFIVLQRKKMAMSCAKKVVERWSACFVEKNYVIFSRKILSLTQKDRKTKLASPF